MHVPYYFMLVILSNLQFDFHNELPPKIKIKNVHSTKIKKNVHKKS